MNLTANQQTALQLVISATLDAIKAAGPSGAPAGPLYAALMAHGATLNQFDSLMSALVRAGRVTKEGDIYFIA